MHVKDAAKTSLINLVWSRLRLLKLKAHISEKARIIPLSTDDHLITKVNK